MPDSYFLFVGTLEPRKNLVGLAQAYRELKLDYPDAPKLVIAGRPGWHYDQLMIDLGAVGRQRRSASSSRMSGTLNCRRFTIRPWR